MESSNLWAEEEKTQEREPALAQQLYSKESTTSLTLGYRNVPNLAVEPDGSRVEKI